MVGDEIFCEEISTLQINVGRLCDLSCKHCHLSCGPGRLEVMSEDTLEAVIRVVSSGIFSELDITGGAPELYEHLPHLISSCREYVDVLKVRTNLTALMGRTELIPSFTASNVTLMASLPCYLHNNVDSQRGGGVYDKSIACLRLLNSKGYGVDGGLPLNLIYNPGGAFLPGLQVDLEQGYRKYLKEQFDITFTNLFTITNIAIGNFRETLREQEKLGEYEDLLMESFNSDTVEGLMCRHQICVDWDGQLYDCDFNLALNLVADGDCDIENFSARKLGKRRIKTGKHCFACTAGVGSSCSGAIAGQ